MRSPLVRSKLVRTLSRSLPSLARLLTGAIYEPSEASFNSQNAARLSRRAQPLPKALRPSVVQPKSELMMPLRDTSVMKHVSSVSFNSKLGMGTKSALEFSHPLIVRRAKNFEPEVRIALLLFSFFFFFHPK